MRIVPRLIVEDERGRFEKYVSTSESLSSLGLVWKEVFSSVSFENTIRGMHLQSPPFDHYRMVSCMEGRVLDVCIDLRIGSPSYQTIHSEILSSSAPYSLLIPPGVAHGFAVMAGPARMIYFSTAPYSASHDIGVRWSSMGFDWRVADPIVSSRDQQLPSLSGFASPFVYQEENDAQTST